MDHNTHTNKTKEEIRKESLLVTKESLASSGILFFGIAFLILCTRSWMFGDLGLAVHAFLTGVFGYLAYPIVLGGMYLSVMALLGKRLVANRRLGFLIAMAFVCVALLVHTVLTFTWAREGYMLACFKAGAQFPACTVTGLVGGTLVFAISAILSNIGTILLFAGLSIFFGYLCVVSFMKPVTPRVVREKTNVNQQKQSQKRQFDKQEVPVTKETAYTSYQGYTPNAEVAQTPRVHVQDGTMGGQAQPMQAPPMQTYTSPMGAFSPFGVPQVANNSESPKAEPAYTNGRDLLFATTPADNYKTNLIFDPNASVNKRPPVDPQETMKNFVPSYTKSYEESVNEAPEQERPVMIVNDYTEPAKPAWEEEPLPKMDYLAEEMPKPLETASFSAFEEAPAPFLDVTAEEEEPPKEEMPSFSFEREETQPEQNEEGYRRHEYMDLFSPSNPRLFEGQSEEPRTRGFLDEPTDRRSFLDESTDRRSFLDEPTDRRGFLDEPTDRRGFLDEAMDARDFRDSSVEEQDASGDAYSIFDEPEEDPYTLRSDFNEDRLKSVQHEEKARTILGADRNVSEIREPARVVEPVKAPEPKKAEPPKPRVIRPYKRVPLDDFDCRDIEPAQNEEEVEATKETIIATLEDFKVTGATIASVTFGPTVTRYNVALPRSVSPRKIIALDQSIAINLHSSGVNIYPNYEDGVVSIEVPNKERQFVKIGCMLSGNTFVNAPSSSLMFTMGKNVANAKIYGDISKMIHMLVAGSSGSGKSVFLGSLIISLIYKYSPEELRLILIDPKKTEFVLYNDLPHLMINEIITDVNKTIQTLNWAIGEMNRRYDLFEQMSRAGQYVVNLDEYNSKLEKNQRLPKIVIIIDELADLMLAAKKEMEDRIQNLTQKARAAGIHLIVATQRPSTDVITGVIKSNLATRIAFYVASDVDSRVILDQSGAQKLLGKGDLLYTMPGINTPVRVQSAFISPEDSQKVVNYIKANNEAYYDEEATAFINNVRTGDDDGPGGADQGDVDPMYIEALRHVIMSGSASISMIQRKCSAGYNRAGRIIEWMEEMGYISAFDGAKARKVLISKEEFESIYGPL